MEVAMRIHWALLACCALLAATSGSPCSVMGDPPTPAQLTAEADVIAQVRADGYTEQGFEASPGSVIRFAVLDVVKGSLKQPQLLIWGTLVAYDDFNDGPGPYTFIRPT